MAKDAASFLADIQKAIETVVGPKKISQQTFLKRDLGIHSIDLVDIFFELENLTGFDVLGGAVMLAPAGSENLTADLQVGQLLEYLVQFDVNP